MLRRPVVDQPQPGRARRVGRPDRAHQQLTTWANAFSCGIARTRTGNRCQAAANSVNPGD
jgi:hypothetical protein